MGKTAVIFPGVGYTKDRPLLYYAGKQAVRNGYELMFIDFGGIEWSKEKLKDHDFLQKTLEYCLKITEDRLKSAGDLHDKEVLFISKSIGTVVATAYARKMNINTKHICFSPLEMIEGYIKEGSGILVYGDADPYADHTAIEKIGHDLGLKMYCVHGGNHSLETGEPLTDIDNLKDIISAVFA